MTTFVLCLLYDVVRVMTTFVLCLLYDVVRVMTTFVVCLLSFSPLILLNVNFKKKERKNPNTQSNYFLVKLFHMTYF